MTAGSADQLASLKAKEDELLDTFSAYIKAEENHLLTLRSVLQLLYINKIMDLEASEPITAYKLMERLRLEWTLIVKYTKTSLFQAYQDLLEDELYHLPNQDDIDGAALGIIRLQEMYKLYPENVTTNPQTGIELQLNWGQSFNLGKVAYLHKSYQHAFLWFLKSLSKIKEIKEEDTVQTKKVLYNYLSVSASHLGHVPFAIYFATQRVNLDPSDLEARLDLALYKSKLSTHTSHPDILTLNETSSSPYEALCRGEDVKTEFRRTRQLTCRYNTGGGNPRLMYAPVKEEEVWDEPPIMIYHNVLSDSQMEQLKNLSRPWLKRSEVVNTEGEPEVSYARVSQTVWLNEDDDPLVSWVNQRLSDITGMDMESAEELQVLNYGIGGHFKPHYDALLSDVSFGGSTVFPKIGTALKPQKGSVVMWYNLLRNGQPDYRSLHAGCPVYKGSKWVAVKWIRERGQEFRRKCALSETE
ncbi:prolyl 4-hydroxylase subunit alpha-1 [Salminus brasiliensis]|uniref:prolyl 4-hydroxylase subunit alpha-1 n=1 Tax=Salminus brasiliensis TaxID=930266 RepID=UPI003B8324C5